MVDRMKGKFITFEGCEGVGKSRQISLLEEYLKKKSIKYTLTREPGGTSISEQIRKIILDSNNIDMADECEALLYSASRAQLIKTRIMPLINNGELVFCDRYIDSSFAYQAYARGLGEEFVAKINSFAIENCMPDFTVFLDLTPEKAFLRKGGVDKNDRVELSGRKFHEKVYLGYKKQIENNPERFIVIDASGTKEQTHAKIIKALTEKGVI